MSEYVSALMEQVEAIEDKIAEEVGLTQVMRKGQELGSQRDQLISEIARIAFATRPLAETSLARQIPRPPVRTAEAGATPTTVQPR